MENNKETKVYLKAYTMKELSKFYGVSEKIMRQWIALFSDQIGKKQGRYFTPKQSRIIFIKLGIPKIVILH